jgi:metal-responsive CopG/Arc/MetJ family transcriptional regulator
MRTVQLTLDEELVDAVDRMVKRLGTTRSGFTREALRAALVRSKEREMERKHREGYLRKPSKPGEFQVWEKEEIWGGP